MTTAWLDGELLDVSDARISVLDVGIRSGIGVFETVRVVAGRLPPRWADHLARAATGAERLGFHLDTGPFTEAARALVAADGRADVVLRLTATAGSLDPASPFPGRVTGEPTVALTLHEPPPDSATVTAITVAGRRSLATTKSTSYADATSAARRAASAGADEALLVVDSWVQEGATSSVAAVLGDELVTPTGAGLLPGVTIAELVALAAAHELAVVRRALPVAELVAADEALLTSAVRGVRALVTVDRTPIGDGHVGPRTRTLAIAWRRAHGLS